MSDFAEIVILCEDKQQYVFIHRFLRSSGIPHRRIRVCPYPSGRGSGEQFVRESYAVEVKLHRSKSRRMNLALIVMQDCDRSTVEKSMAEFDTTLASHGEQDRKPQERIAVFFPRRSIETWLHFLLRRGPVNEEESYPYLAKESDCHPAADHIAEKHEFQLFGSVPPSLRAACPEIRRIFPDKKCLEVVR